MSGVLVLLRQYIVAAGLSGVLFVLSTMATSVLLAPRVELIVHAFPVDGYAGAIAIVFPVDVRAIDVPRTHATILSVPIE